MSRLLARITHVGETRPRLTLGVFTIVALVCAGLALSLAPSANLDTLVSSSNADYRATQTDYHQFGGQAVDVLVQGNLQGLVAGTNIVRLSQLEACLDGSSVAANSTYGVLEQVPASRARPYGGASSPCGHLMATRPTSVVYGPATFLNQAVLAVNRGLFSILDREKSAGEAEILKIEAAAKARGDTNAQVAKIGQVAANALEQRDEAQLLALAARSGLGGVIAGGLPSIQNADFIDSIVFGSGTGGVAAPKARFSYLFPSADSALIQVRLRPDLSTPQVTAAIHWITAATRMSAFRLSGGGTYLVSGQPVVLNDLSSILSGQIVLLLVGAVIVMAIVLLLIFRTRRRLLPLGLALAAAAITFGLCKLAGGTLTMASIAGLPILIGLAVDYGIQFQSRASGAVTIAAAATATATGFLALLLSPVPMVRGFGLLLVLGVIVAFLVVLSAGSAALALDAGGVPAPLVAGFARILDTAGRLAPITERVADAIWEAGQLARDGADALGRGVRRLGQALGPSWRGALEIVGLGRLAGPARTGAGPDRVSWDHADGSLAATLARLSGRPRTIVVVGLALAVGGWVADTQTAVQSNVQKLVPTDLPALRNLNTLERVTGESGELDVVVHAPSVATPAVLAWMERYETAITRHFGYDESRGCDAGATVCPALSLPDLFATTAAATSAGATATASTTAGRSGGSGVTGERGGSVAAGDSGTLSQASIDSLLDAVPAYFSSAVINAHRDYAALSFGIRLMPLSQQIRLVAYMRRHLDPPAGVRAELAGLPVLAADADASLSSSGRRLLTLVAGLMAVGIMLMAIFRRPRRALVPLVPIVLATGWSALIVYLIGIPLNPMSATLGALVIAISTEFSVLLAERFRRQRRAGEGVEAALESAYRSTGRAVVASGITAIAGFAVLIVSNVTMLADFGLVTLIDLSVSLLGVLAVLPAVLTLSEGDALAASRAGAPRHRATWRRRLPRRLPRPGLRSGGASAELPAS